jgi:hypothetical protein
VLWSLCICSAISKQAMSERLCVGCGALSRARELCAVVTMSGWLIGGCSWTYRTMVPVCGGRALPPHHGENCLHQHVGISNDCRA